LARYFGHQEAAVKRLSRLLHNERLDPRLLADAVLLQALHQLPTYGKVRLAIDWTIEADQHLLVVSLVVGRRAVPIYWRAYDTSVLKGRMKRYELAVIRRAVGCVAQAVGKRRVMVTADRGFADVALFDLLSQLGVTFIIRVKAGTNVSFQGKWCKLGKLGFRGNEHHRSFGALVYCESCPQRLWVSRVEPETHRALGPWATLAIDQSAKTAVMFIAPKPQLAQLAPLALERDVGASFDPDDERDAQLTEQVKQGHISETPIRRDHDAALPNGLGHTAHSTTDDGEFVAFHAPFNTEVS